MKVASKLIYEYISKIGISVQGKACNGEIAEDTARI
jgi:hypothetical protein